MGLIRNFIKKEKEYVPMIEEKQKGSSRYFNNLTGFRALTKDNAAEIAAHKLNELFSNISLEIDGYCNGEKTIKNNCNQLKTPSKGKTKEEKNNFSATKNDNGEWGTKPEDVIERMIKFSYHKMREKIICENQIAIPDTGTASHFDLLKKYEKTIEIVELKQWDNTSDPPTWAVAECLKNLYMFLHLSRHIFSDKDFPQKKSVEDFKKKQMKDCISLYDIDNTKIFKLVVLAPKDYYDYFFESDKPRLEAFGKFCRILEKETEEDLAKKLGKKYDIQIEILQFNFARENGDNSYEKITNAIIKDHISKRDWKPDLKVRKSDNVEVQNTGEIKLSNYITESGKPNKIFPIEVCEALVDWETYNPD